MKKSISLQQLFVASADDESTPEIQTSNADATASGGNSTDARRDSDENSPHGNCIVCHTDVINRALLPCRHACVCDGCFLRLDKCPMCRSVIESYFQLTPKDGVPWSEDDVASPKPWYEDWNDRLNAYLGFQ